MSEEKRCAFCGAVLEGVPREASGDYPCGHCRTRGRYEGETLVAIYIPGFFTRLGELERRNREILADIELESIKGEFRDMEYLRGKHLERQDVLSEYALLSHFRQFVEKW